MGQHFLLLGAVKQLRYLKVRQHPMCPQVRNLTLTNYFAIHLGLVCYCLSFRILFINLKFVKDIPPANHGRAYEEFWSCLVGLG